MTAARRMRHLIRPGALARVSGVVLAVHDVGIRTFLAVPAVLLTALIPVPEAGAVRIGETPLEDGSGPGALVTGPDGNLYVAESGLDRVEKVRPDGASIGQFALGAGSDPVDIVLGPADRLYLPEFTAKKIARVSTAGAVAHFPPGTTTGSPRGITVGPDGNIWIVESGPARVGRLRLTDNNFQEFGTSGMPIDIAAGPDGNLWITDPTSDGIRRMTPDGLNLPLFTAGISPDADPTSIVLGPDGNLWFAENTAIGRITPTGTVTEFSLVPNDDPNSRLTTGPDGNLWFTQFNDDRVGRITPEGAITLYKQGITSSGPNGITTGPDGRLWFSVFHGDRLGIVTLEPPTAVTGAVTSVRHDSASVTATVNPLDYATTVRFEYGPTNAYGSSSAPTALPAGSSDVPVSGELTGLTPEATVHYRVVATSAIGSAMGSDLTLDTTKPPRVRTPVRSRFLRRGRITRVRVLKVLRVPAGATIQLRCRGRGCFRRAKRVGVTTSTASVNLRRRFLRRTRLRPGAVLEVRILAPSSIGRVVRFTTRRTRLPRRRVLCLPLGVQRPERC